MKQKEISKAYPIVMRLCSWKMPIAKSREIYKIAINMKEHFDFALNEEKKCVEEFGGVLNPDGTISFSSAENFSSFQSRVDELNESELEWEFKAVTLSESDMGNQLISAKEIMDLEKFVIFE